MILARIILQHFVVGGSFACLPRFRFTGDIHSSSLSPLASSPVFWHKLAITVKQVGVAAWLQCWLSHLGLAGLSPGHDN